MKNNYVIKYRGVGRLSSRFEQQCEIVTPYSWNKPEEAAYIFEIIKQEIQKYFDTYEILSVDLYEG